MKTKEKYETPLSTQMLMEVQGVLAASPVFGNETPGIGTGADYLPGESEEWFNEGGDSYEKDDEIYYSGFCSNRGCILRRGNGNRRSTGR